MTGDLARAEHLLEKSVERHRHGPAAFYLGWSLRMLGRTLLLQGRPVDAQARIEESLRLFAPAGDVSAILLHLTDFAALAALEGDDERVLQLFGALDHLKRLTGTDVVDHPVNAIPGLEETVTRLGADGARLLAEGSAVSVEEAVRYALREPAPARPSGHRRT